MRDPYTPPHYDETDDFLQHLGASDEEIEQLGRLGSISPRGGGLKGSPSV